MRSVLPTAVLLLCIGCATVGEGALSISNPDSLLPFVYSTKQRRFLTLDEFARILATAKVVFIGEFHDEEGCHNFEYWALRAFCSGDGRTCIGMEMFQRPFQKVLDRYINGKIDEEQMLKETEYHSRWGFDYKFYAPILRFCKAMSIRVIALNLRREISKKIAKEGINSLSPDERYCLPEDMDFSNERHKRFVLNRFEAMMKRGILTQDKAQRFYEAQVAWDETMAETAAESLCGDDGAERMLVIAGAAHISHRFTIPERFRKRSGYDYISILPQRVEMNIRDLLERYSEAVCDYVYFFTPARE